MQQMINCTHSTAIQSLVDVIHYTWLIWRFYMWIVEQRKRQLADSPENEKENHSWSGIGFPFSWTPVHTFKTNVFKLSGISSRLQRRTSWISEQWVVSLGLEAWKTQRRHMTVGQMRHYSLNVTTEGQRNRKTNGGTKPKGLYQNSPLLCPTGAFNLPKIRER